MDGAIPLSVIIFWRDPREDLAGCLRGLLPQVSAARGEVLVVGPGAAPPEGLDSRVRWVPLDPPSTEPRAWELGAGSARGATVAFGQARCRYAEGWAESVLSARAGGEDVVAGPVRLPSGAGLSRRAAYLCDYGAFADPAGQGGIGGAASNNVAFAAEVLPREGRGHGLHKVQVLAACDRRPRWVPGMAVTLGESRPPLREWTARFPRGRSFAARRAIHWPPAFRLAAGASCVMLPLLLYARMAREGHLWKEYGGTLVFGLPLLMLSLGLWSLGEMFGYWMGPGRSARAL
jgi:hypothetical protein